MKHLMVISFCRLDEMLEKGNVWYMRNYELYFDRVTIVYLIGRHDEHVRRGNTTLVSIGKDNPYIDLILAPVRLLRIVRKFRPTNLVTADIFFSFWTMLLVRLFYDSRVLLVPICIPDSIYRTTGRSITGLPIAIEKFLSQLCYILSWRIVTTRNSEASVKWLRSKTVTARRLHVVPVIVDEFPPPEFLDRLLGCRRSRSDISRPASLLYVGRLHAEKLVLDLVEIIRHLKLAGVSARLYLVGDGPEMYNMKERATALEVEDMIEWVGFVDSKELPEIYENADAFVSTVTGTALREAGLCGLPVVSYDADWAADLLVHEKTALMVPVGDTVRFAAEIERLLRDNLLRCRLANAFYEESCSRWSVDFIRDSIREMVEQG